MLSNYQKNGPIEPSSLGKTSETKPENGPIGPQEDKEETTIPDKRDR